MNKLIYANLSRLLKDKVFFACVVITIITGILTPLLRYNSVKNFSNTFSLEGTFSACSIILAILLAVFCSLFVGTEYSDGTIRNKIIVGHSRATIYYSFWFTNIIVVCILCTIYFIISLGIGLLLQGTFETDLRFVIELIFNMYILTIAYSSIFTLISMLEQNKALVAVICILSTLVFFMSGTAIYTKLAEPEMIPANTSTNGSPVYDVDTPNPSYVDGLERGAYEFLYDFLPGGQTVQYASMQVSIPYKLSIYSSIIIVITTGIGLKSFKKKDIR